MMVVVCVIMLMIVRVIVIMMIVAVRLVRMIVVVMRMIMIVTAVRSVHMNLLCACRPTGLAPRDRLGHQPVFLGLRWGGMAMCVAVIMVVFVMRVVVMMRMIMMPMIVIRMVVAADRTVTVGAALRLEGCLDEHDFGAEFLDKLDQYVIVANAQRLRQKLRRRMTIAEMPGDACNDACILGAEFDETLGLALDEDDRTGFQLEAIAVGQRRRIGEIDVKFAAIDAFEGRATAAAVLEIKLDGINGMRGIETAGFQCLGRSDHSLT
jgi:hypothetical protein